MHKLDTISIRGFKSIALVEKLPLRPINVVIGPNGSGKSNFIGVFLFLHAIRDGRLNDYVVRAGGADKVLHFGSKVTQQLRIEVAFNDEAARRYDIYDIYLQPIGADELAPQTEAVSYLDAVKRPAGPPTVVRIESDGPEARISEAGGSPPVTKHIPGLIDIWRVYHFCDTSSSSPIRKTADVDDNRALRGDASNLAAILYYLRMQHATQYALIRRTIQLVAPFFDDFVLEPQKLNPNKIRLEWRHKTSDGYFDASSLSDGTLRFIALATLFLQPDTERPAVILVDEPELGLHPYAITMLASLVKQASHTSQVIVSTQSPTLLDHFSTDDVLVADLVAGATQLSRLNSHDLAIWLQDYSLGQLWEKNELGGRPGG